MRISTTNHIAAHSALVMVGIAVASVALSRVAAAETTPPSQYERIEPNPKQMEQLEALTPEGVAAGAVVEDDDLEPMATITTIKAYQSNGRFTDRVRSDNYLRAFIDKRTGETRYQVFQKVSYTFEDRRFTLVNYATPAGPVSAELTDISHQVVTCYGRMCSYEDQLGFLVPRSVLESVAKQYADGTPQFWRFRFKSQTGTDWEDRMTPAEVQGLLIAVDRYRAARGLPAGS